MLITATAALLASSASASPDEGESGGGCARTEGQGECLPDGTITYTLNVTNNSAGPISQILLTPAQGSSFTLTPPLTNLSSALQNGQTTSVIITIAHIQTGQAVCFFVTLLGDKAGCCNIDVCPALPTCGGTQTTPPPPPPLRQQPKAKRRH
jgi:uncharacterized repeat protein (TIGR01451 family)